jgi:hypothetical protein
MAGVEVHMDGEEYILVMVYTTFGPGTMPRGNSRPLQRVNHGYSRRKNDFTS